MAFECVVVTPEQQAFSDKVTQAIIPAHDGLVGILTDRSPLLVKLGIGPLRLDLVNGQRVYFLIDGGVAQMKDNKLTVLTQEATPSSEITADAARAEVAAGTARRAVDAKSANERERQLARGRAMQQMVGTK
jgi:F-type H+-transporting ATPase subunit epsilon